MRLPDQAWSAPRRDVIIGLSHLELMLLFT